MQVGILMKIQLVKDTIDSKDIESLIEWLRTNPKLTKGSLVEQFEYEWKLWNGSLYSVFVNSGSSANLAVIYALKISKRLKNDKIVVPAVSWVTTVSPVIQFGMEPILCEADEETLGIDTEHFENICKKSNPAALILVHVLGIPSKIDEIKFICDKYDVILIEDSCESIGSLYKNKKTGTFGIAGTYSFYYGHHISTIEGGMISTDDFGLYCVIKSIRAHGWNRDLPLGTKIDWQNKYDIDRFHDLYTFYYPGFNLRPTDLQAFLGLQQMKKIDQICCKRNENLKIYDQFIENDYWKLNIKRPNVYISNFAYPVIVKSPGLLIKLSQILGENGVETRPLVAGNIGLQPFWMDLYGKSSFEFADIVHCDGMYLPNNHQISDNEIKFICGLVSEEINNA